ncbi:MAG: FAD-binding oxidoreductase [Ignavibacteriae bacterium]|nr:FAD-binding oxidoreductase [Ignavibacteria bacterium]MBI3363875.1 FAD-binding oxidoreductase [Ignavibacteriota bacterium]
MKSADVVIIGGGVIGASVAYHLAQRGSTNVIVLDRGKEPGEGSTGKATGGFRVQFSTEISVRLSLLSRDKLLRFKDEIGIDSGYRPYGYLFAALHENELHALRDAMTIQQNAGVREVQELTPDDIRRLNPAVNPEGIIGGTFSSLDGFIRPMNILLGYTEAAGRVGVKFEYGAECLGFTRQGEKITGVRTSNGSYTAEFFVNAAGAWAGVVAQQAGIEIPVHPHKRQVAVTYPTNLLPEEMPMTIFTDDGFHLRVRDGRILLLLPVDFHTADPFDTTFDESWLDRVVVRAHACIPCLREVTIDRANCWAGLYEMSPDKHQIVGLAPGLKNFFLVNGSSGHGVMHAPALGQLLSEIILDGRATTLDVRAIRPTRFAEGKPNAMSEFL